MKKLILIALAMSVNFAVSANVIGPNKSGIYHVDQWGNKKPPQSKETIDEMFKKFPVKSQTALL